MVAGSVEVWEAAGGGVGGCGGMRAAGLGELLQGLVKITVITFLNPH